MGEVGCSAGAVEISAEAAEHSAPYASSTLSLLPSADAAHSRVDNVTDHPGAAPLGEVLDDQGFRVLLPAVPELSIGDHRP